MERDGGENIKVVQLCLAGFPDGISANDIIKCLQKFGHIRRCRLKKSSTPASSFPYFGVIEGKKITHNDKNFQLHAYLQCGENVGKAVIKAAAIGDIDMDNNILRLVGDCNEITKLPSMSHDVTFKLGYLAEEDSFVSTWGPCNPTRFLVDESAKTCQVLFDEDIAFFLKDECRYALIRCNLKIEFSITEVSFISKFIEDSNGIILLEMASSPCIFYRTAEDDILEVDPCDAITDDDDPWIRTTDCTPLKSFGSQNVYCVKAAVSDMEKMLKYFSGIRMIRGGDKLDIKNLDANNELKGPFWCTEVAEMEMNGIFWLNAFMHKANIYRPLPDLIKSNLVAIKRKDIVPVLRSMYFSCQICDARSQIHLTIAQKINEAHQLNNKRFDSCVEIKKLVITPTKGYCIPCGLELSNRVLREFGADSFIRVSFTDEGTSILSSRMLNFYTAPKRMKVRRQHTSIYQRIENILTDGCTLGNEHFVFLAFSNSQLKDRSAWFTTKKLVSEIRSWMGDFRNLNVAKCSARMGLCFSSTYETINVPSSQVLNLLDIKCNNYVFSDGIGKISSSLAAKVAKKLQLSVVNAPSAYQIRYGGYKGVVTCWPEDRYDGIHLFLRNSMLKFQSEHTTLEVCSWSKYHACFLNRQIIVLLSTLGIQDDVFIKLQQAMVRSFDINLANNIRRSSAETINAIKMMLEAGFQTESEPFLEKMVYCRKLSGLQGLKNKARIYVPDGRLLMGCLDELNILEAGQCFIKVSSAASYPEVYDLYNINFEVVQGKVAIAKNPCHHPGDIRVLNAVDVKELYHLNDCLVFPQKGKRPHADETSGSDLDGDLYFVTWNEELIPSETFEPMIYSSTKNDEFQGKVTDKEFVDFFLKYMTEDKLGSMSNAHLVQVDQNGARSYESLKLAESISKALDCSKSGEHVIFPENLKPKAYPHYMEKTGVKTYISGSILGKLYDQVKELNVDELSSREIHCDPDLVISGAESFKEEALTYKKSYDLKIAEIQHLYSVTEVEIVTGNFWSLPKGNKQNSLKQKIMFAYENIWREFRSYFEYLGPEIADFSDREKQTQYEAKASCWYQITYGAESTRPLLEEHAQEKILSFPWIAVDYLCCTKKQKSDRLS